MDENLQYIYNDENTVKTEIYPGVILVNDEGFIGVADFEGRPLYLYMEHSTAEKILSPKAIQAGYSEGGHLYYSAPHRYTIPLHELLSSGCITDPKLIRRHDMDETVEQGKLFCTDYFGELEHAKSSRQETPVSGRHILNGFDSFLYADGSVEFVIHEKAIGYYISNNAIEFGEKRGDFYHYQNDTCAIPIFELHDVPEFEDLIDGESELLDFIGQRYPEYLLGYAQSHARMAKFCADLLCETSEDAPILNS